ncbi:LacI family DNA-binding transcriptional regulator [Roseibium sp. SCP14]|uniref:LacI family DNA-binding transcriptional regulator n=1 Tax=Roseibium sp. SCP14 TaxID=3141375 RepID=UPI00333A4C6E
MKKTDRNPTIQDVAQVADVAIGTVSRYLNGFSLRKSNRLRIEKAIEELGYQSNSLARSLKTDRTNAVAFVVPSFDEFNSRILTSLVTRFRAANYTVVTFHHEDNPNSIVEALEAIAMRKIDGVIMSGALEARGAAQSLLDAGRPVILYNNDIRGLEIDRVLVDNRDAARRGVEHLFQAGHRRIGIVTGDVTTSSGAERLEGYKRALTEAGLAHDDQIIFPGRWRAIDGYAALDTFMALEEPPTAVLISSCVMAEGFLEAMKMRGVQIGKDLSLISFDDNTMFRLFSPGIAAIAQPTEQIAGYLTDLMLSRLAGGLPPASRTFTISCELVVRESIRNLT